MHLDPHEKPPEYLRVLFKRYRNANAQRLQVDPDVVDLTRKLPVGGASHDPAKTRQALEHAFDEFSNGGASHDAEPRTNSHATSCADDLPQMSAVTDVPGEDSTEST